MKPESDIPKSEDQVTAEAVRGFVPSPENHEQDPEINEIIQQIEAEVDAACA